MNELNISAHPSSSGLKRAEILNYHSTDHLGIQPGDGHENNNKSINLSTSQVINQSSSQAIKLNMQSIKQSASLTHIEVSQYSI